MFKKVAHLQGHAAGIFALSKGREPNLFFSGSSDKMVAEWLLDDYRAQKFSIKTESFIYSLCYVETENLLFIGLYSGGIHIIDLDTKKEIKFFTYHQQPIFDIKFCASNKCIYVLSGDGSFSVWDAQNFMLKKNVILCKEKIRNIDFNASETIAAIACGDGQIRILETSKNEIITEFHAHQLSANCVKFHPNKKTLVSGGRDACLRFWNIQENFKLSGEIPAHNFAIYDIAFSPDEKLCATASRDKTAKIWDAKTFEIMLRLDKKNFDGHTHSVNKLMWTAYKNYLITASDDRTMIVWKGAW